jgi:hypothetical protein
MNNTLAPLRLTQTLGVAATSQHSNTSIQSQKGSVYMVWHDSLHAPEHARGCMEQLMEATSTLHYSRSCPSLSSLLSARPLVRDGVAVLSGVVRRKDLGHQGMSLSNLLDLEGVGRRAIGHR